MHLSRSANNLRYLLVMIGLFFNAIALAEYPSTPELNIVREVERNYQSPKANIKILQQYKRQLEIPINYGINCIKNEKEHHDRLKKLLSEVELDSDALKGNTVVQSILLEKDKGAAEKLAFCSYLYYRSEELNDLIDISINEKKSKLLWQHEISLLNLLYTYEDHLSGGINWITSTELNSVMVIINYVVIALIFSFLLKKIIYSSSTRAIVKYIGIKNNIAFALCYLYFLTGCFQYFLTKQYIPLYNSTNSQIFFDFLLVIIGYCAAMPTMLYLHKSLNSKIIAQISKFAIAFLSCSLLILITLIACDYVVLGIYLGISFLKSFFILLGGTTLLSVASFFPWLISREFKKLYIEKYGFKKNGNVVEIEYYMFAAAIQILVFFFMLIYLNKVWKYYFFYEDAVSDFLFDNVIENKVRFIPINIFKGILTFSILSISCRYILLKLHLPHSHLFFNILYIVSILFSLYIADVNLTGIAIVASAFSFGVGMGLKDIVNNFFSGVLLILEKPFKNGDVVEIDNKTGLIKKIGLRSTLLKTINHEEITIPNSSLLTQAVSNFTSYGEDCTCRFEFAVEPHINLEKVHRIIFDVLYQNEKVLNSQSLQPLVRIHPSEEGEVLLISIMYMIKKRLLFDNIENELYIAIHTALREQGVFESESGCHE